MVLLKVRETTKRFEKRIKDWFSENSKEPYTERNDYSKDRLERDTQTIEDFVNSKLYKEISTTM